MRMRMPNGYGSVVKFRGNRRQPYAVRTSEINEFINIKAPHNPPYDVQRDLKRLNFKWNGKKSVWSALSTEKVRELAEILLNKYGYIYEITFKQTYKFHAYFEKADLAYAYLADMNSGKVIKEHQKFTDTPTFAEMFEKWVMYRKNLKNKISESTWRNYNIAFNHLAPLHSKKFIAIKTIDIQEVLNQYNLKSQTTISSMRAVLKGMYSFARMNGYVDTDLTDFLVYEWTNPEEDIHAPYTEEEIGILWKRLYDINNVDIILIYIYTGLRPSELLNILTENVHLEEQYMVGGMKTDAGKDRIIPIADKILPLVKNRFDPSRKYLINNKYGNHYTYGVYVSANFNTVMNRLGMKHLPHDSRHTFATLMNNAGANDVCTKIIMGHSLNNDVTKGVYTHKSISDLLREVNKI